jgi:protein-S-isoprenylcysteine O-methyltransferase Ste14
MDQLILAYLLLLAFFLPEAFIRKSRNAKNSGKTKDDKKSTFLVAMALSSVLILSEILNLLRLGRFRNAWISIAGLALMVTGLVIRSWSMLTLQKFYTRTLHVQEQQQLIKKGPYKHIRHPGYLGTILTWEAAGLAMQNFMVLIVAVVLISSAYIYRIQQEEKMLLRKFGDDFLSYKKHSWRLIPFIW